MNIFSFLFVCTLLFLSPLSAKSLHLLILGDTTDNKIGLACLKNTENIKQSFAYLASVNQLPFFVTELTTHNDNLTREDINRWIRKAPIASDDILVLYYSGHGSRERRSPTIWPSGKFQSFSIVEFSEIMDRLFSKKAAFYLVLLDCCNVLISKDLQPDREKSKNHEIPTFDFEKLNKQIHIAATPKLFSKKYGVVIVSSTSPREFGWSQCPENNGNLNISSYPYPPEEFGSVFTKIFLNNFFSALQEPNPEWENILKKTQTACMEETKKESYKLSDEDIRKFKPSHKFQTPQYRICLHKKKRKPDVYKRYLFEKCRYLSKSISEDDDDDVTYEKTSERTLPKYLILSTKQKN